MTLKSPLRWLAVLLGTLAAAQAAPILYVSNGADLFSLDPSNAAVLSTQALSATNLKAMTFSATGVLYGLFTPDGEARLGTIDPASGFVSFLALTTGQFTPTGLAFNSSGSLYGLFGDQIFALDASTGAAASSPSACGVFGQSLAFTADPAALVLSGLSVQQVPVDGGTCPFTGSGSGGGTGSTGSGSAVLSSLEAFTITNGTAFSIGRYTDGARVLLSFDASTYSPNPALTQLGSLASTTSSIAAMENTSFVPEPGSVVLLGVGVGAMLLLRRYR
jgi:streptogramin lyase